MHGTAAGVRPHQATRETSYAARPASAPAVPVELDGIVHVLTCGSVDDGKSTLIGRLLWDAGHVQDDQRALVARSAGADGVPDFSLLVDGLMAEREQGITIDIAWRYVDADARRIVVIDAPGHEQYTRNMASGASHADVAIMLVDARHGLKPQTRRHAAILDLVGVRHVILAVNKMDLVGFDEARFRAIETDFQDLVSKLGFDGAHAIPVSAKLGDNIARGSEHMPWYRGRPLVERLDDVPSRASCSSGPFRFPVQTVLRDGGDMRGVAGTIVSGRIEAGAAIRDCFSGREARISRIVTMDGDLASAESGRAVTLVLDRDLDIARGAVLVASDDEAGMVSAVRARFVWLADAPMQPRQRLLMRTATDLVPVASLEISARIELETLAEAPAHSCAANDIVAAEIALARPAALDLFHIVPAMGCFVLVDAVTGATVAGGAVQERREAGPADASEVFRLTRDMLEDGLCAGLSPRDPEFRRRAEHAAFLLKTAGVAVTLDLGLPDLTGAG